MDIDQSQNTPFFNQGNQTQKQILQQVNQSKISHYKNVLVNFTKTRYKVISLIALVLILIYFYLQGYRIQVSIQMPHPSTQLQFLQKQNQPSYSLSKLLKYLIKLIQPQPLIPEQIQHNHRHIFKQCIKLNGLFLVNMSTTIQDINNDGKSNSQKLYSKIKVKNSNESCQIQVIGIKKLSKLIDIWNQYQTNQYQSYHQINDHNLNQQNNYQNNNHYQNKDPKNQNNQYNQQQKIILDKINPYDKKVLLILLKLYYQAGTYVQLDFYNVVSNRCWRNTLIDFDILFGSVKQIANGIIVPDFYKFIRTRYPYTPMIKNMIQNIINGKQYDTQCRQRQCLIVSCDQNQKLIQTQISSQAQQSIHARYQDFKYNKIIPNDHNPNHTPIALSPNLSYSIFPYISQQKSLDITNDPIHKLITYQWKNNSNQIFQLKPQDSSTKRFKIYNRIINKVMKINDKCQNSMEVLLEQEQNTIDQVWEFVPINQNTHNKYQHIRDNQYYFYIQSHCGRMLNLFNGQTTDGGKIILWDDIADKFEIWAIYPVYHPQFQFSTIQQYERAYINLTYHQITESSFSFHRKIKYLQKRIKQLHKQVPFWMYLPESDPVEIDLPQNSTEIVCAHNHLITYIWMGNKQMPDRNKQIVTKCKGNVKVLGDLDWFYYSKIWDQQIDDSTYLINKKLESLRVIDQIDLLKLLYLYFQSGVYSDFDTQINEKCFTSVYTQQVIFTNNWWPQGTRLNPEENFMKVNRKFHPQVKLWIQQSISTDARWRQCGARQCLILRCQRHDQVGSWKTQ